MNKILLTGNSYIMIPNSPRHSKHKIVSHKNFTYIYVPERIGQKIWHPLEGVNLLQPFFANIDLVHLFNAIVYTQTTWIVTFEAELPRLIGYEGKQLFLMLRNRLALDNCKKIISIRVAEKAKKKNLPINLHIISRMTYGLQVYADCVESAKFQRNLTLLKLDNVIFHKSLPNEEVINLLATIHFQIMCIDDTYGFSILEGFSVGTPAITTNVGSLPEFVNRENGLTIDLEVNEIKNWLYLVDRRKSIYWSILDNIYETLAERQKKNLIGFINLFDSYEQLSVGAIAEARKHNAKKANNVFDELYIDLISN